MKNAPNTGRSTHRRIVACATISLMITVQALAYGHILYQDMVAVEQVRDERLDEIDQAQWQYILAIIKSNNEKGALVGQGIKKAIIKDLEAVYPLGSVLREDMLSPSVDSPFVKIFSENIDGLYLNVNNDNNDPWIGLQYSYEDKKTCRTMAPYGVIITDKSTNCSVDGEACYRRYEEEALKQANPDLANVALDALLKQESGLIFWQYLKPEYPALLVPAMTIEALEESFLMNGLDVFDSVEFLVPVYIGDDHDILGVEDVTDMGTRADTIKVVIVNGWNLSDALSVDTQYSSQIQFFDDQRLQVVKVAEAEVVGKEIAITLLFLLWFVIFISTVALQNNMSDAYDNKNP